MTVHVGSFYDPHPPMDLLVHGNTRNHVRSNLEVTCKMVGQNQTSELLAAAKEEIRFGLHWPCKVKLESALRAAPFMSGPMVFLGKQSAQNHQEQPPPVCNSLCKVCLL